MSRTTEDLVRQAARQPESRRVDAQFAGRCGGLVRRDAGAGVPGRPMGAGTARQGLTDRLVAQAFDAGEILRTHAMRPTWHFVARADIRWLQMLTGPRVQALNAYYARKNELDAKTVARSRTVIERALRGRPPAHADRDCRGAGKGRDSSCRRPAARLPDDERRARPGDLQRTATRQAVHLRAARGARAKRAATCRATRRWRELTRRYFTSHGPATLRDYVWWSGLTMEDARRGVEIAGRALVQETFGDVTCWSAASAPAFTRRRLGGGGSRQSAYLLPIYDEYLIAYKDRGRGDATPHRRPCPRPSTATRTGSSSMGWFSGTWRRAETHEGVEVSVAPHRSLTAADRKRLPWPLERYSAFLEIACRRARAVTEARDERAMGVAVRAVLAGLGSTGIRQTASRPPRRHRLSVPAGPAARSGGRSPPTS